MRELRHPRPGLSQGRPPGESAFIIHENPRRQKPLNAHPRPCLFHCSSRSPKRFRIVSIRRGIVLRRPGQDDFFPLRASGLVSSAHSRQSRQKNPSARIYRAITFRKKIGQKNLFVL